MFFYVPQIYVWWKNSELELLNCQCHVQDRNGEAWERTVSPFVLNTKEQTEMAPVLQEGVAESHASASYLLTAGFSQTNKEQ